MQKNSELSYFEVSVQKRYCAITDIEIKRRDVILPISIKSFDSAGEFRKRRVTVGGTTIR